MGCFGRFYIYRRWVKYVWPVLHVPISDYIISNVTDQILDLNRGTNYPQEVCQRCLACTSCSATITHRNTKKNTKTIYFCRRFVKDAWPALPARPRWAQKTNTPSQSLINRSTIGNNKKHKWYNKNTITNTRWAQKTNTPSPSLINRSVIGNNRKYN